jgi:hypothetical protein
MTSNCFDLPSPFGNAPVDGSWEPLSYEDVYPLAPSPPHSYEDSIMVPVIDMSEAAETPLPYDEDDNTVPGDEVRHFIYF